MSPALKAHQRLLERLPVRTHFVLDEAPKKFPKGKHSKLCRPVIAFGKKYKSIADAARATGRTRQFIYWRVCRGKDCWYAG